MEPLTIIKKYYKPSSKSYHYLVEHGRAVAKKALQISRRLKNKKIDRQFLKEAAILHDIGIFLTYAPEIECFGRQDYIRHCYLGGKILRKGGLPKHARVCENHIDITKQEIISQHLPLPKKNLTPKTIEEEIISYADRFYSKADKYLNRAKSLAKIRKRLKKYGARKIRQFETWHKKFSA